MQTQIKKLFFKQAQLPKRGEPIGIVDCCFLLFREGVFKLNEIVIIILK